MRVLVGCDMVATTPLPQYMVVVHGPFTRYVVLIRKQSSTCIHQRNNVNDPYTTS
jgi:hypothetical protein